VILGITGHRPPDLGGYSEKAFQVLVDLAKDTLVLLSPRAVIQGMALGWDQAVATACWELDIPYGAYIPFEDQPISWPKASRFRWATLRDHASVERLFGKKYDGDLLKIRNKAIVDDSDKMLANYNGYVHSGTGHAVNYAKQQKKEIINVYGQWITRRNEAGLESD